MYGHRRDLKRMTTNGMSKHTILIVPYKWSKGYIRADLEANAKITPILTSSHQRKILQMDDMHPWTFDYEELKNWCLEVGISYILCRYTNNPEFKRLSNFMKPIKCVSCPWYITETQYNYKEKSLIHSIPTINSKKYDILFYGVHFKETYPMRFRLYTLLKNKDKYPELSNLSIFIVENNDGTPQNRIPLTDLTSLINESWITIATPSKYDYMVRKYIEIPASNSVVMGKIPVQAQSLYGNNYIKLTDKMTDQQIITAITTALNDKEKLENIIRKMRQKIVDEHTIDILFQNIRKQL